MAKAADGRSVRCPAAERDGAALHEPAEREHRRGNFACAGCDLDLFSSTTKFDSGTGWPSFWAPLEKAVGTEDDMSFGMVRTAVHCSRCGGHLGHVFDDGPAADRPALLHERRRA